MTGENKVMVWVLVSSIALLLGCVFMLVWNIQTSNTPWVWFWALLMISPVATGIAAIRRWDRG